MISGLRNSFRVVLFTRKDEYSRSLTGVNVLLNKVIIVKHSQRKMKCYFELSIVLHNYCSVIEDIRFIYVKHVVIKLLL